MARQCHLNTCPAGIATQREDLRAKFTGTPWPSSDSSARSREKFGRSWRASPVGASERRSAAPTFSAPGRPATDSRFPPWISRASCRAPACRRARALARTAATTRPARGRHLDGQALSRLRLAPGGQPSAALEFPITNATAPSVRASRASCRLPSRPTSPAGPAALPGSGGAELWGRSASRECGSPSKGRPTTTSPRGCREDRSRSSRIVPFRPRQPSPSWLATRSSTAQPADSCSSPDVQASVSRYATAARPPSSKGSETTAAST